MKELDPFEMPLRGVRLIEANAGTGKTYTITTLYLRLLLERRLETGRILVVTYTNAATAELRSRVRARIADLLAALRGTATEIDATIAALVQRRRAAGSVAADCQRLEGALYGFDEAAIFTIHGFCQRILQEHAFESGVAFDTELIGDERLLIDEVVRDFWTCELYTAPPELVSTLAPDVSPTTLARLAHIMATHPDLRVVPERPEVDLAAVMAGAPEALVRRRLQMQIDFAAYAARERRARKEASNTQSFDDLLQRLDLALRGPGAGGLAEKIRTRFPAALIDEFQDTDPVQARIFDAVYRDPGAALFLIGDPKQAIYGFRGADVFTYVGAKQRVDDDAYALNVNWRSSPGLVRAVDTVFSRARAPFVLTGIPFFGSKSGRDERRRLAGAAAGRAPLRVLFARSAGRPLDRSGRIKKGGLAWFHAAVAGEITQLLNADTRIGERRVIPGDVAVLARTNQQSADMQAALTALGVPSVMYGDKSVFDTAEANAVDRVMRAMADPGDGAAIASALLTPILALTVDGLAAARRDEHVWEAWVDRFQSWSECWKSSGFTVAFRRLLDEQDVLARILSRPGGERSITNVLHLGEMLQQAAVDARRGPLALIEWLQRMRHDEIARAEDVGDAAQIRLESDTQALKLITVHKSKGLQYPVVVCPFLWDAMLVHPDDKRYVRWHDPERDYRLSLDLGSERVAAHRALCKREALAEHLRLLYVALTRAEHLCLVAWGPFAGCEQSALGYLIHQDANVPEDELVDATRQRIESLSEEAMRADVERLAAASDAAIEVTELSADQPVAFAAAVEAGDDLRLRTMPRPVRQPWRLASFSALAAVESPLSEPVEEGVDRDEIAEQAATTLDEPAGTAVRGFPRGRRLGNLVHKLFETIDFTAIAPTALREQAQHLLPGYGIEAQWGDAICDAIGDVLDTPLDDQTPPLTLRRVPNARRLNELEFVFPVALAGAGGGLLAAHLADVFATHGAPWLTAYPARVRRLPFPQLAGYLKGFIDLVFAHGDRWFIVDYKTNDLGGRPADYRAARLLPEMQRHHYVLQYHLYSVALHRYLERRLTGYDYARHFGGVLYLFVRGMAPSHERGCGVFFDRPAAALVESLSDTLARPPTAPSGRVS